MVLFMQPLIVGAAAASLLLGGCAAGSSTFVTSAQAADLSVERNVNQVQTAGSEAEDEAEGADVAITGGALDQASAAALAYVGQGKVTGSEVGDEEGYYEIEVTLDNGSQVDVHLDENFNVLGQDGDSDQGDD
jgi:hypothetical protein